MRDAMLCACGLLLFGRAFQLEAQRSAAFRNKVDAYVCESGREWVG